MTVTQETITELVEVLRQHHNWHQQEGLEMKLGDEYWDCASCYVDSTLEERTTAVLAVIAQEALNAREEREQADCPLCGEKQEFRPYSEFKAEAKTGMKLLDLLEQAAKVKMTPSQIAEQRRSWVRGNMGLMGYTDEQIERAMKGVNFDEFEE